MSAVDASPSHPTVIRISVHQANCFQFQCHKQSTSLIDELKKPFSEFWTQVSSSRFDLQFAKLRIPWLSWPIMRTFQVSSSGLDGRTFATQIPSFFGFGFNREKYRKKYRKAVQKENLRRRRQNVTEKLLLKIQNRSLLFLKTHYWHTSCFYRPCTLAIIWIQDYQVSFFYT